LTPTIDKAIAPILTAGVVALIALLTGGVVDVTSVQGALATTVSGLVTAGLVYFVRYNARTPNKALAALLPLALAAIDAWQTGEVNSPEVLLAVQGVVGAAWTYAARRFPRDDVAVRARKEKILRWKAQMRPLLPPGIRTPKRTSKSAIG
jgi:hypothetical protein